MIYILFFIVFKSNEESEGQQQSLCKDSQSKNQYEI